MGGGTQPVDPLARVGGDGLTPLGSGLRAHLFVGVAHALWPDIGERVGYEQIALGAELLPLLLAQHGLAFLRPSLLRHRDSSNKSRRGALRPHVMDECVDDDGSGADLIFSQGMASPIRYQECLC